MHSKPIRSRRVQALATVLVVGLASSCATDETPNTDRGANKGTTMSPNSRPTRFDRTISRQGPDGAAREIQVQVWIPDGDGPFPAVAFAHGLVGHPDRFGELFQAWVDAGYAVIAPRFPYSAGDTPNITTESALADMANQPDDVRAAVDDVLGDAASNDSPLFELIQPEKLVLAGLSMGGGTVLMGGYHDCCRDDRYLAVIAFSPLVLAPPDKGDFNFDGGPPMLLMHGTADAVIPFASSEKLYGDVAADIDFITLQDGAHSSPYEQEPSPFDALVREVSVAYLDLMVKGDSAARQRMVDAVNASSIATMTSK